MSTTSLLQIRYQPVRALHPYAENARIHSKRQIRQIADSIQAFGFTNPILVDRNNMIAAGHGRVEAAKLLSIKEVPTVALENLSEDQIRAYIIADNKLAENAGWDKGILSIELQYLMSVPDLDITVKGFEVPEIDIAIGEGTEEGQDEPEEQAPMVGGDSVSVGGDLWELGSHRLFCGSALEDTSYQTLLGDNRAATIFTDPPYNVKIDGHATGNGAIHHREFSMASGEMTDVEFSTFLSSCISNIVRYSKTPSVHYLCMDFRHIEALLGVGRAHYDQLLNLCVWVKDSGGMGSFYRSQHELVAVFRNGKKTHRNNVQLGRFGRNRTNVWHYPGIKTLSRSSEEGNLLELHPTVKPIKMVADAILDCTKQGDSILDPFSGSGTTVMAAERVRRRCFAIEIDPLYVDTTVRRWQAYTGMSAVNVATKKTFSQVADERGVDR